MSKLNFDLQKKILNYINEFPNSSFKEIYDAFENVATYSTIQKSKQELLDQNFIVTKGTGKATKYAASKGLDVLYPINLDTYFEKEIDDRDLMKIFNLNLIKETLCNVVIFSKEENEELEELQKQFRANTEKLSDSEFKSEFERYAIDLSWKSSLIEGNTYSLLETERLLKEKEKVSEKSKEEAIMLLNHKKALDFILENTNCIDPISVSRIVEIHDLLIEDLGIDRNIRKRRIGISGTNYKPLDNVNQIKAALHDLCFLINSRENIFEKAFFALLLLSYIHPFSDGNKRTARIVSNAILINNNYCPLSFRTVNSIDYKKALLVFFEQNNVSAFKKIFRDQYEFAVNTYF